MIGDDHNIFKNHFFLKIQAVFTNWIHLLNLGTSKRETLVQQGF